MRLKSMLAAAPLLVWAASALCASQQRPLELFAVVQQALGAGTSMGLVVERRDLRRAPGASDVPGNDVRSLEQFAATSSDWDVSFATVPRVTRRVRPREVDELLATPVRVSEPTLTAGRAMFIVPRVAVHGTLTGVAGGGVPSEACRLERDVQIDDRTRSLAEFLDAVAAQAPGIAWVLTWDADSPRDTLSLGVMCPDGSMSLLRMSLSR